MLPRLAGMRKNLGRQGGGSGRLSNKGAGEEQLELDRRHIERQLAEIRRQLKEVEKDAMCSAIIVTRDAKGEETQISWDVTPTLIDATFSTGVKDNELREECK